jgi:nucleotide-binding universal stress UspA family protein
MVEGAGVVEAVLPQAKGWDLIVVVAIEELLFKNLFIGKISEQIARRAMVTMIMVTGHGSPFYSFCARQY